MISIIVPIYNAEKYLCRCIDCILNQTYADFELILVDDGSPDRCPDICDQYAQKDSRVRVIHQTNCGLSAARNAGMCLAKGEFILFCDSDDYVNETWCESLIKTERASHDNFIYGSIIHFYDGEVPAETEVFHSEPAEDALESFFKKHTESKIGFACNVLFYSDILRKKNIRFRQDIIIEDLPFCLEYLQEMKSLTYCPGAHYYYMQRKEETLSRKYHQDGFRKWQEKYAMLQEFISQRIPRENQADSRKILADYYLYFFLDSLNNSFDSRSSLSWIQKMCYNQRVVQSPEFRQCISLADPGSENPRYLSLLKKGNYYAAYLYVCAAKMKSRLKR